MVFGLFEKKQVLSEAGLAQVAALMRVFPSTQEVDSKQVIYEQRVTTQGWIVTLRIVLPPAFPQEAPVITLKQNESDHAIRNPSIDNVGRFHTRLLVEWNGSSATALAAAVREVVNVLETPEAMMFPTQSSFRQ